MVVSSNVFFLEGGDFTPSPADIATNKHHCPLQLQLSLGLFVAQTPLSPLAAALSWVVCRSNTTVPFSCSSLLGCLSLKHHCPLQLQLSLGLFVAQTPLSPSAAALSWVVCRSNTTVPFSCSSLLGCLSLKHHCPLQLQLSLGLFVAQTPLSPSAAALSWVVCRSNTTVPFSCSSLLGCLSLKHHCPLQLQLSLGLFVAQIPLSPSAAALSWVVCRSNTTVPFSCSSLLGCLSLKHHCPLQLQLSLGLFVAQTPLSPSAAALSWVVCRSNTTVPFSCSSLLGCLSLKHHCPL